MVGSFSPGTESASKRRTSKRKLQGRKCTRNHYLSQYVFFRSLRKKPSKSVILSEAKNLGSCSVNELRRSFLRFAQDRPRLLRMTAWWSFSHTWRPPEGGATIRGGYHSYRKATMGSRRAAFIAGQRPKKRPMATDTTNPVTTDHIGTVEGRVGTRVRITKLIV